MGKRLFLAIVAFVLLVPPGQAPALNTPLGTVAAPVEEVVTQVTTALPPVVPTRPPAAADPSTAPASPAATPAGSQTLPSEPPISPASVEIPIVKAPGPANSSPPIDRPTGRSPAPVIDALSTKPPQVSGDSARVEGVAAGPEAVDRLAAGSRPAGGAAGTRGSGAVLRSPLVAPLRRLLAYVWPAVALARPGLARFLGDAKLGVFASLAAARRHHRASATGMTSGEERVPEGDVAVAEWLGPRSPALGEGFAPYVPLSPAVLYLLFAIGSAAIWCISRWEVGLRSLSRHRRL
jgi:hypothetical protein